MIRLGILFALAFVAGCADLAGLGEFVDTPLEGAGGAGGASASGGEGGAGAGAGGEAVAGICAPAPPSDWSGPVAVRVGNDPDALDCPAAFSTDVLGGIGDPGGDVTCSECACDPPRGGSCPTMATLERHLLSVCDGAVEVLVSTETCTTLPDAVSGYWLPVPPSPEPGMCEPSGGDVDEAPPAFAQYASVCAPAATPPACDEGVPLPDPGDPTWALCVYQEAELPSCPPGSPYSERLAIATFTDDRICTGCDCSEPKGVTCGLYQTQYYQAAGCQSGFSHFTHEGMCGINSVTALSFKLQAQPFITNAGTCTVSGGEPNGAVDVQTRRTLCCLPGG